MSRDTALPNRHVLTFERGWLAYKFDVPDQFEWGVKRCASPRPHRPGRTGADISDVGFPVLSGARAPRSAFLLQLRNVVAAVRHRAVARLSPGRTRRHRSHRALLRREVALERTVAGG